MPNQIVVVGAGGFGRETLDVVEAINASADGAVFEVFGVLDDGPSPENLMLLANRGIAYLGTITDWIRSGKSCGYVIGIGNPTVRSKVAGELDAAGMQPITAIHPTAVIGSQAKIGKGVVICAGVQVSTNVTLGDHVHVNPNATIGHDTVIGPFVSLNPGSIVSGAVHIDEGSLVGAGAVILQGLQVGEKSLVGAGACVVRNVPSGVTVKGVPAR